jgi:signal transduction histidine kinase/ligand-binding sensor domain-containing protein/DNA-binding response OmpR family regulator
MTGTHKSLIFILFFPCILFPVSQDIKFEHFTVEDGLSNNKLRCILQDKHGFIWIGTEDGLNKYDGYKFTIYRNNPLDSLSLSSNWITALHEDRSGDLWISTMGGGLNKFNYEKEIFIRCNKDLDKPWKWKGMSAITMKQIGEYQYGDEKVLWIGTYTGLHKMDPKTQSFTHYPHTNQGQPYCHVQTVAVDKSGMVWIGSLKGGIHRFNPKTEQFTHYKNDSYNPNSLSDNRIFALHIDRNEILWIGTAAGGLNRFDPEKEKFISYKHYPNNPRSISSNNVISIYEDHAGVLWIGTADGGLNIFDRNTQEFTRFMHDSGNPTTLNDNTVWHIYEDRSNVLWLGTWGGINKIVPSKKQFVDYKKIPGNLNSLNDNYAGSIYISTRGRSEVLWIGTRRGLNKIDRKTGKYTHYINNPDNTKSIPSVLINSLFEDKTGILWIGTYGNGLIKFDPSSQQFTRYSRDQKNPNSINDNMVYSIFEDKYGVLWISTDVGGINLFDRDKETFTQIGDTKCAMHILEDSYGDLWIAAWPGLRKYDRETGKFIEYYRNRESINSPELNRNNFIHESCYGEKNILWIGTYSGLNKFDRKSEKFTNYTVKDGLPNNVINGILEDELGNLWLSTNNGLSKFNPKSELFKNYDINDGLLSNQFSLGGCYRSKDGEMFFSSSKGVNAFYPDRLFDNPHTPKIVVTDFQLFNKSVSVKKDNDTVNTKTYLLNQHISLAKEIKLSYQENIFSFEFAALDYSSPEKNQYAYMLDGFESNWNYTNYSRRYATYTNLNSGTYVFRVKGSNNDGLWNKEGISIKIIITPPWWETNLAYSIYLLLICAVVFTVWRVQTSRLKMKHRMEMDHLQTEKLQEVDHMKSRFFANISHEFRTPLTLIEGPVKQMLSGEFKGNMKEQFKIILRNSGRLLKLINQLLDLSKLESGKLKLKARETEIISLTNGLVQAFESLAVRKKITLNFNSELDFQEIYIDVNKFEKIINNLLSNAFKFTTEQGTIEVSICRGMACHAQIVGDRENVIPFPQLAGGIQKVKFQQEILNKKWIPHSGSAGRDDNNFQFPISNSDFVEIIITNTGSGIPTDKIDKIFDRFYQVDDSYTKDEEGTGIGLALTKEFVELHHGTINVDCRGMAGHARNDSDPNAITTFTVSLPLGKDHLKEDELIIDMETADRRQETGKLPLTVSTPAEDIIEIPSDNIQHPVSSIPQPTSRIENKEPSTENRVLSILIVEDNTDLRQYIRSNMNNEYQIIEAENGEEGLEEAINEIPALIISDVMMPKMDGFEFCTKIKTDERTSHIPVILITARAEQEDKIEGLETGADDYISKPFDNKELLIRVKNLIEQRRKLRERFKRESNFNIDEFAHTSADEKFVKRVIDIISDHISDVNFNVESLTKEVGMSRMHLHRKILGLFGQSPGDFLRTIRLKRGAVLLKEKTGNISEIAYDVGFDSPAYFSNCFRNQFGLSPSEYIKNFQNS